MDSPMSCRRLEGKTALVTAGTKGIGEAIVERLLSEGAKVYLCSRKDKNVVETIATMKEKGYPNVGGQVCHVGKVEQLESFVKNALEFFQVQRIDIVVSNAALNPIAGNSLDIPDDLFDKMIAVNIKSYWKLVQLTKPHMVKGSSVVFISSVGGLQPAPPVGIYGMCKTSIIALARVLSQDLGREGIRVNSVCPGIIKTRMSEAFWKGRSAEGTSFLNTYGEPSEVASVVAFLVSSDSSFITGESIVVSGGSGSRL